MGKTLSIKSMSKINHAYLISIEEEDALLKEVRKRGNRIP
jgi:hypothetical protein